MKVTEELNDILMNPSKDVDATVALINETIHEQYDRLYGHGSVRDAVAVHQYLIILKNTFGFMHDEKLKSAGRNIETFLEQTLSEDYELGPKGFRIRTARA
jgi:hypothetical protein